jgi:hypothetical protein
MVLNSRMASALTVAPRPISVSRRTKVPAVQRLEDDDYPAYTMGRATELIGATPAFLRAVEQAGLITPQRSGGGHRRYSRHQLRLVSRVRALADAGTAVEPACRIVLLEDRLDEALRANEVMRARLDA